MSGTLLVHCLLNFEEMREVESYFSMAVPLKRLIQLGIRATMGTTIFKRIRG